MNRSLGTLLGFLFLPGFLWAQEPAVNCNAKGCQADGQTLVEVRSRGEDEPKQAGHDESSWQANRRVEVGQAEPGRAVVVGRYALQLPNGGVIWASEDPARLTPELNVQAPALVPFASGRISKPVHFSVYSNYGAFIQRLELRVYRADDRDRVAPLVTLKLPGGNITQAEWDGRMRSDVRLREGDQLQYVLRAYGADGVFDETFPNRLQLVSPQDYERGLDISRREAPQALGSLSGEELNQLRASTDIYGNSNLFQQNILIRGSRLRIFGQNLPKDFRLRINGESVPVDLERKFVAEYLLPVGPHKFDVELSDGSQSLYHELATTVTGRYLFLVALADVTLSDGKLSGSIEPLGPEDHFDDFLVEGRLAFYLKGKVQGRYLITAQADTTEREAKDLFDGFFKANPQDVFRRLDPDLYYPVYGDDSTSYRDTDSQGRLYVRVEWDKSQAIFGNFQTDFSGTQYAQYLRSLYGGSLNYRSRATTQLGEARTTVKGFASEAQSALGHSEFIGTGGSLYYLRHTDLLPGSDLVQLEVRDPTTGSTVARLSLQRDLDYEIDNLQGRIILNRPLSQITREAVPTLTRDRPLDGLQNRLLVDYEYVPTGFSHDDLSGGVRLKQWLDEHFALGATYVDEKRAGDDYTLTGADLTVQAGRGTYLKIESSKTESSSAPVFFSDNGGLSFSQLNVFKPSQEGEAHAIEGRMNFRELGWSQRDWSTGAWWRELDSTYSVPRFDQGQDIQEFGADLAGYINEGLRLSARASHAERGSDSLDQALLQAEQRLDDKRRVSAELRQIDQQQGAVQADATLAALRYDQRLGPIDAYVVGQASVARDDAYAANNAGTLGAKYNFGDLSSVGAEYTAGNRGEAAQVNAEYRLGADHTLYGAYTYSTDTTVSDPLFGSSNPGGLTLGQRWRMSSAVNLYNESQWLKSGNEPGITHTFGMDFYPEEGWNLGFALQTGELEALSGTVDRNAASLNGGFSSAATSWASKLEYRRDSGAEERRQWVTTHRVLHKLNESLRLAARLNYADTEDLISNVADARFTELNLGFAYRPWNSARWALFGKYTFLYDLPALGQQDGALAFDQRSQVFALEGTYRFDTHWEGAGKYAHREGEARLGRNAGPWFDTQADFAALQARYRFLKLWNALAEYRWLNVEDGGLKQGALIGVDRDIGPYFRLGAGYNFSDFSDDLTKLGYTYQGWFINAVGRY